MVWVIRLSFYPVEQGMNSKRKALSFIRSLMQDLQDLGLTHELKPPGQEHVLREDAHLDSGPFGLRATIADDTIAIYTWKPNVRVQTVAMTRDEALKLAALIHKQWPLDALGQI